MGIFCETKKKK